MLKSEFEKMVGMTVSSAEYSNMIEPMYMLADQSVTKQQFAKVWVSINKDRIAKFKADVKAAAEKVKKLEMVNNLRAKLSNSKKFYVLETLNASQIKFVKSLGIDIDSEMGVKQLNFELGKLNF